jgi:hypothetical protein
MSLKQVLLMIMWSFLPRMFFFENMHYVAKVKVLFKRQALNATFRSSNITPNGKCLFYFNI